jgi:hypothetical protein
MRLCMAPYPGQSRIRRGNYFRGHMSLAASTSKEWGERGGKCARIATRQLLGGNHGSNRKLSYLTRVRPKCLSTRQLVEYEYGCTGRSGLIRLCNRPCRV